MLTRRGILGALAGLPFARLLLGRKANAPRRTTAIAPPPPVECIRAMQDVPKDGWGWCQLNARPRRARVTFPGSWQDVRAATGKAFVGIVGPYGGPWLCTGGNSSESGFGWYAGINVLHLVEIPGRSLRFYTPMPRSIITRIEAARDVTIED